MPLCFQVARQLERMIESGELTPGTRLDNEIALAERVGLSRPTMRRALDYLIERGLLVRRRGAGTQVVHAPVRRPAKPTSRYDQLANTRGDRARGCSRSRSSPPRTRSRRRSGVQARLPSTGRRGTPSS